MYREAPGELLEDYLLGGLSVPIACMRVRDDDDNLIEDKQVITDHFNVFFFF